MNNAVLEQRTRSESVTPLAFAAPALPTSASSAFSAVFAPTQPVALNSADAGAPFALYCATGQPVLWSSTDLSLFVLDLTALTVDEPVQMGTSFVSLLESGWIELAAPYADGTPYTFAFDPLACAAG